MTFKSFSPALLSSAPYFFFWLQDSQIDFLEALILNAWVSHPFKPDRKAEVGALP